MDMFASDLNSVSGAQNLTNMNITENAFDSRKESSKTHHSVGKIPSRQGHHGHKQTQEFSQSGFDLVDRIYDSRKSKAQNQSMHDISINEDLSKQEDASGTAVISDIENSERFR